ncbi:Cytoplasmic tRNA 2-thiolation protein 2 [Penicillium canariense]|uniref:Cytoplasmic tRNA 2-thiolation protein 2 n=1 Tax=Penicillium canariense TaxID=189055 RepID=A0A9W9I0Z9_9EURO|nr:Cytoplasmic tRNA 2-thiolation protein 2 [Penicillium canariense]KAJ5160045.1 Cytoplasmic tRNA 2-thiolation protein 2 [Penicillium canariense]
MADYRQMKKPNIQQIKLLLPLSLGVSSSILLHILNADIQRQLAKPYGGLGYDLHILVVDPSTILPSSTKYDQAYEAATKAFPDLKLTRLPFHSVFEYVPDMKEIIQEYTGPHFSDDESRSNQDRLAAFRAAVSTATSKADLDSVLLTRLVVGYAKNTGCEVVIWGDSDSRLAAKTLAGVAKGRGASLTWSVSDGMSPWGVRFGFPLRDLSKPELEQYKSVCEELSDIIISDEPLSDNVLTKNLSIDELMMRYVHTQGEKYRGVMANVTRTANKLESTAGSDDHLCPLCGGLVGNVKGNSGVTVANQSSDNHSSKFCYGCMRSRPEATC